MLTIGRYFKKRFGQRVRKIPISLSGFTCPNIDGYKARGGCIYCKNETFSPSLVQKNKDEKQSNQSNTLKYFKMNFDITENPLLQTQLQEITDQFYYHSSFHKQKFGVSKYLIYFQSFTNTYAPLDTLKALYEAALKLPSVVGLSIGTRIDCVSDELLDFLESFVKNDKEIWLEYGIQSVFDKSLEITNRAHSIENAQEIISKTRKRGIKVCVHLIYGLPGESIDMMLHSLKTVLDYGIDSLKIHPLYVVQGTMLAKMYAKGEYNPITLEDYGRAIVASMQMIPSSVVIQRVSAGAHDDSLIAPLWCFDKNVQMRYLRDELRKVGINY